MNKEKLQGPIEESKSVSEALDCIEVDLVNMTEKGIFILNSFTSDGNKEADELEGRKARLEGRKAGTDSALRRIRVLINELGVILDQLKERA